MVTDSVRLPVLFVGHGSPMNLILDNDFTRSLARLGQTLPRPRAIMVISAHWLTQGTMVTCDDRPKTIYDFYGFPRQLYELQYPAPGSPELARRVRDTVVDIPVACGDWGLDHASWAVLRWIYPQADIPVFEMSLDYARPAQYHYELATQLAPLRREGLLIVGSGNIVHNLRIINPDMAAQPYSWATEFDELVKTNLLQHNHRDLIEYPRNGRIAQLSVPTHDHYLPMLYAIALQEEEEPLVFVHEGMQHGSVSMRCFQIG